MGGKYGGYNAGAGSSRAVKTKRPGFGSAIALAERIFQVQNSIGMTTKRLCAEYAMVLI